jgi:DNA repair protein RadC
VGLCEHYGLLGPDELGDLDLLAIAIGAGRGGGNELEIAVALLGEFGDLRSLLRAPPVALTRVPGIGPVRAVRLHAALRLGMRAASTPPHRRSGIQGPESAWTILRDPLATLDVEELHGLYLDRRNRVLGRRMLSRGNDHCTIVDPRQVFRPAIQLGAAAVVVAHNHPSGDPTPSDEDRAVTRRLVQAGQLLGVPLVDHIVVGGQDWRSLAELGEVPRSQPAPTLAASVPLAEGIRDRPHTERLADDDQDVPLADDR